LNGPADPLSIASDGAAVRICRRQSGTPSAAAHRAGPRTAGARNGAEPAHEYRHAATETCRPRYGRAVAAAPSARPAAAIGDLDGRFGRNSSFRLQTARESVMYWSRDGEWRRVDGRGHAGTVAAAGHP